MRNAHKTSIGRGLDANAPEADLRICISKQTSPYLEKTLVHELGTDGPQRHAPLRASRRSRANFVIISRGSEEAVVNFRPWGVFEFPGTDGKSL